LQICTNQRTITASPFGHIVPGVMGVETQNPKDDSMSTIRPVGSAAWARAKSTIRETGEKVGTARVLRNPFLTELLSLLAFACASRIVGAASFAGLPLFSCARKKGVIEMLKVLKVRADGTAVVSTKGLFRVITGKGAIAGELLESHEAEAMAESAGLCGSKFEIVAYASLPWRKALGV
jgi:hypothetical protein